MGTTIVQGKAIIVVTAIGDATELGSIAHMMHVDQSHKKSPLEYQLTQLGYRLLYGCAAIILFIVVSGFIQGIAMVNIILTGLSLAIAAIPEGLPTITTITLAIGVHRMLKRNALIRRLVSIETLGCTSIICVDKTGTLTKNEMSVQKIWINHRIINVTGTGYAPEGNFFYNDNNIDPTNDSDLMWALTIAVLCNNAHLENKNSGWQIIGDPTEGALLTAAHKARLNIEELKKDYQLIQELPFSSERKRMSMVRKKNDDVFLFIKGAPDSILQSSSHVLLNGIAQPLDIALQKTISDTYNNFAQQALRVLAIAYKKLDTINKNVDQSHEKELIFVGLFGIIDPPRTEVQDAIERCKGAGIDVIMITGDYHETAQAIAQKINLVKPNTAAISGKQLETMSDEQLRNTIKDIIIYARVTPEHKVRIVKTWQSLGHIVAMTGDGVNDAPALKSADIAIAMGSGTQVTKEAADMVILDNNFASIVNAIEEGRAIYDNITKFISYLISSNIAELIVIFLANLLGLLLGHSGTSAILAPIQILWLNLISDGLPALALSFDPADPHIMERPPRSPGTTLITANLAIHLCVTALIIALGTLCAYYYGLTISNSHGQTMALTTLILLEFVRIYIIRLEYNIEHTLNWWLIAAIATSIILQGMLIYVSFLQTIFKTEPLSYMQWIIILTIAAITWLISFIYAQLIKKGIIKTLLFKK